MKLIELVFRYTKNRNLKKAALLPETPRMKLYKTQRDIRTQENETQICGIVSRITIKPQYKQTRHTTRSLPSALMHAGKLHVP